MAWLNKFIFLLLFTTLPLAAAGNDAKLKKGVEAYQNERWDEALSYFQAAVDEDPENPQLQFNLGSALYKKERYEDAAAAFEKSLMTRDIRQQENAYFNQGNAYYRLEKYQEAVEAYKKALDIDPEDQAAKHNLELVRARLKEMADKQQQQQQDQQQKKIEPSEYAKQLKAQAEIMVAQRFYQRAYNMMIQGLQADETVAAFQDFIQRIKDVVDIEEGT